MAQQQEDRTEVAGTTARDPRENAPLAPVRARVVSDGTSVGTTIEVDGRPLAGVASVRWSVDVGNRAVLTAVIVGVELDAHGDLATIHPAA